VKIRDSGMPEEEIWNRFFSPVETLRRLGFALQNEDVADIGCGYGTFSVAAAQLTSGTVHAIDIDPEMTASTDENAHRNGLRNIKAYQLDFLNDGTGLPDASVSYAMLFNILHTEDLGCLLREAFRVLSPSGTVAVMHWIHDERTPRGPSLAIRPRPEHCVAWLHAAGFTEESQVIDLPPYHYGLFAQKNGG
jgi:SAM-dependent methyltransferase